MPWPAPCLRLRVPTSPLANWHIGCLLSSVRCIMRSPPAAYSCRCRAPPLPLIASTPLSKVAVARLHVLRRRLPPWCARLRGGRHRAATRETPLSPLQGHRAAPPPRGGGGGGGGGVDETGRGHGKARLRGLMSRGARAGRGPARPGHAGMP